MKQLRTIIYEELDKKWCTVGEIVEELHKNGKNIGPGRVYGLLKLLKEQGNVTSRVRVHSELHEFRLAPELFLA